MAPWFNLILDEFVKYSKKDEAFTELGKAFDDFDSVAKEGPEYLATWTERFGEKPLCFLITGKNKRTAILHHLVVEESHLVGLSGFRGIATPKSVSLEEASGHLINPGMAKSILKSKLPTLKQMIKAKNVSGLLAIKGDSAYDIASLEEENRVSVWTPQMLSVLSDVGTAEKTHDLLFKLVRFVAEHNNPESLEGGVIDKWERRLQLLWVSAKEWNQTTTLDDPPYSPAVDKWFLGCAAKLAKWESTTGTEPEELDGLENSDSDDEKSEMETDDRNEDKSPKKRKRTASDETHDTPRTTNKARKEKGRRSASQIEDEKSDSEIDDDRRSRKSRDQRRRKSDDPSDPSSSDSDPSDSSDSDDQQSIDSSDSSVSSRSSSPEVNKKARRKKTSRKRSRRAARANMGMLLDALAFQGRESVRKERKKNSLLARWTPASRDLFRLLSAKSWKEKKMPKLNSFSTTLTSDKQMTRAERMISMASRNWEGEINRNGLVQFLTAGFLAQDIVRSPGGFTVFMFTTLERSSDPTKQERIDHLREIFGDGKMSESSLKSLADTSWSVPLDFNDAQVQLSTAIAMLDLLTRKKSIASDGYRYGLSVMKENSRKFVRQGKSDKLFFAKYLYFLDRVFQNFCSTLLESAKDRDPFKKPYQNEADEEMMQAIKSTMRSFLKYGANPNLPLPEALEQASRTGGTPPSRGPGRDRNETDGTDGPKKRAPEEPWMRENPSPVKEWLLPDGKTYGDFFGTPDKRKGFPRLKHHRSGKKENMCLQYAVLGKCKKGGDCPMGHYKTSVLTDEFKAAADKRFGEVYGS